jgi:L-aminopeptidase/D-esterase-like protein
LTTATVEAVEEAISNAMVTAETMTGINGCLIMGFSLDLIQRGSTP